MKRIHTIIGIALLMLMAACDKGQEAVHVSEITLNSQALTLVVGDSEELTATVSPFNADNATILWTTSNASVAKVDKGIVTAIAAGTATITAKADDGGLSDVCEVTVISAKIDLKGITLETDSHTLVEGESMPLRVSFTPADATDKRILWESSDSKIAIVDENGLVYAVAPGIATITATSEDGRHHAACEILVTGKLTGLSLDKKQLDLVVEDEADLKAVIEPSTATQTKVRWTSTRPEVASVDLNGHIIALNAGKTIIIASTDPEGYIDFCRVSVRNRVESITVTPGDVDMNIHKTEQLSVSITPSDLTDVDIVWKSEDESVATVSAKGLVTAKGRGKTKITASTVDGRTSGACNITVIQPVTKISVTPESLEMYEGETTKLTISMEPEDADITTFYCSSSPDGFVTINKNGEVTAKTAQKASDNPVSVSIFPDRPESISIYATCKIKVKAKVKSVSIDGDAAKKMNVGGSLQLSATVKPDNAVQSVTWASSNKEIASIDQTGKVSALKVGKVTVTATSTDDPSQKATCTIEVQNIQVSGIRLDREELSLVVGETAKVSATVTPDDAFDKSVKWASDKSSIASVSDDGEITAKAEGTATITVTSVSNPKVSASCKVTVSPKEIHVTSVSLSETECTLEFEESKYLTATVIPENAPDKELEWTSSAPTIVEVDAFGKITGKAYGTAEITVTTHDGGHTASCTVHVAKPPIPVSEITLSLSSATIEFGETLELTATILPEDATNKEIKWKSSKTNVATVTDGVVVAGTTGGETVITVSSVSTPKVTATCTVTVKSHIVKVTGISLDVGNLNLYVGQTKKLTATIKPSNADNKNVTWSAGQGGIVMVSQNGEATGLQPGKSTIKVTSVDGGYQATCSVNVTENKVASVSIDKSTFKDGKTLVLKVGESFDLQATVTAEDTSAKPSYPTVIWSVSGGGIAKIDTSGHVVALSPGTVTITAVVGTADNKKTDTCTLVVLSSNVDPGGAEGVDFEDWTF